MAFAHLYVHSNGGCGLQYLNYIGKEPTLICHLCRIMAQVAFIFVLDLKKDFYDIR